jgi:hypothetical protein
MIISDYVTIGVPYKSWNLFHLLHVVRFWPVVAKWNHETVNFCVAPDPVCDGISITFISNGLNACRKVLTYTTLGRTLSNRLIIAFSWVLNSGSMLADICSSEFLTESLEVFRRRFLPLLNDITSLALHSSKARIVYIAFPMI